MNAVWKRMLTCLDNNAPKGYGQMRPGASVEAICVAQHTMGMKFPGDLTASYRIHDGQFDEPVLIGGEGWTLFSLEEMVEVGKQNERFDSKYTYLVPIARNATSDDVFLNLDLNSDSQERLIIQRSDSVERVCLELSFALWIAEFVDKLEGGEFAYLENHGVLLYVDEIDID